MKPLVVLLIVVFCVACKPDGHHVTYKVECQHCYVKYVNSSEVWDNVVVGSSDGGVLTETWTYDFEAEHDQSDILAIDPWHGTTFSAACVLIDGVFDRCDTLQGDPGMVTLW